MSTKRASCVCGQLRVRCDGDPIRVSICHCLACQQRTGSAFGVQARFATENVQVEGRFTTYLRSGDDGGKISSNFCPECGSTVFWSIDKLPGSVAVAVGAFADPSFSAPTVSVYGDRRHHWFIKPKTITEEWS